MPTDRATGCPTALRRLSLDASEARIEQVVRRRMVSAKSHLLEEVADLSGTKARLHRVAGLERLAIVSG